MLASETGSSYIINITGIGGVGKSALVQQFAQIAQRGNHPVGLVNARRLTDPHDVHNYPAIVEALISLEQTLRESGCELRELRARLDRYRRLHQQLTEKFVGPEEAAVSTILQVGVMAIRAGATVFPVAKPLNAVLTPELATKVSQAIASYRREGDRRLLSQPAEELTSLFVTLASAYLRDSGRRIVLIFDEFELIPVAVEHWLRQCFSDEFGAIAGQVVLVVAGRAPVGQDWTGRGQTGIHSTIRTVQLDRFSRREVTDYLIGSGVAADRAAAVEIAAALSPPYRLPLVLRLLVNDPGYLADAVRQRGRLGLLADVIVDRFLDDRYTTPEQRRIALAVAVTRRFDHSLIAAVEPELDQAAVSGHMDWLTRQHFINPHAVAYSYYDLVRDIFLTHLENTDQPRLTDLHARLGGHYEQLLAGGRHGERMRQTAVDLAYHQLSSTSDDLLTEAFRLLFRFLPAAYEYGISWSRMLRQVLRERADLTVAERLEAERLASVLEKSWKLSVPSGKPGAEQAADPALNILFTSSFDDSLPEVTAHNAELWLAYFESRLKLITGSNTEVAEAFRELSRAWRGAEDLVAIGSNESLLTFRVASDLADIYTRRGDLANALEYIDRAIAIARSDTVPVRQAFALYQLSNNQKRRGEYRSALSSLSEAIDLVRRHPSRATNYYLGRFLLDRGVTHTYLSEAPAAEEAFEASRACFADVSPVGYAELSHRIGWLKRVRGDLDGALSDHEAAIQSFRRVEADLGTSPETPSNVSYSLAKALHSIGNVYAEMCRHDAALASFDEALRLFARQGGVRHAAIVRKDSAWSHFILSGPAAAEQDLIRAITDLGPRTTDGERPAINSATHLAEAWLMLSLIRSVTGRLDEAGDAASQAEAMIGSDENPPLLDRVRLQRGLTRALQGKREEALSLSATVTEAAMGQQPPHWLLAARAAVVEAAAASVAGDAAAHRARLAAAIDSAGQWNRYAPALIEELRATLPTPVLAGGGAPPGGAARSGPADEPADSRDEIIDVYDEHGEPLGQASSRLAHSNGLWHRSFHCWIVRRTEDGTDLVLFQRRGPAARTFSGFFDMTAAGHYRTGEGVEGGLRECQEELGVEVDAAELQLIARRTINEALSNGTVNREFQDIYLLRRPQPAESYHPGFPEVSAVVECSLDDLLAMLHGDRSDLEFSGVAIDENSGAAATGGRMTLGDLISESRAYHKRVMQVIKSELAGNSAAPAQRSAGGPAELLDDGSSWVLAR